VKGKPFKQPIAVHKMKDKKLDQIQAMKELRKRITRKRWKNRSVSGTFWRNDDGSTMTTEFLRKKAQNLLSAAGIRDTPYHIKHATIRWLYKKGVPADRIVRFMRHAQASTTFVDYYLNEELGAACSAVLETSTTPNRRETVATAAKAVPTTRAKRVPQGRRKPLRASKK
jgi:integrase